MVYADSRVTSSVYIRAFDNVDADNRIVINCEIKREVTTLSPFEQEYKSSWANHPSWSYVDKIFVSCGGESFYVDLWNFDLLDSFENSVDAINGEGFFVRFGGLPGQRELLFSSNLGENHLDMLCLARDRTFRIIRNTYSLNDVRGALFTQSAVELNNLEFV